MEWRQLFGTMGFIMILLPVPEPRWIPSFNLPKKHNIHFLLLGWISWNVPLFQPPLFLELPWIMLCANFWRYFVD